MAEAPEPLRAEIEALRQNNLRMQFELAQTRHDRRNLLSEFDYANVTYSRDLHPQTGVNIQHLFGQMMTNELLPERFAPEARPYFSRLWALYDRLRDAPEARGEADWQERTWRSGSELDFTTWKAYGIYDWQRTAGTAQTLPKQPGDTEFILCTPAPVIGAEDDYRIRYTAWADHHPCELSVVVGTDLQLRGDPDSIKTGRGMLQDPAANSYCFAFGAYTNRLSMLQRSLRGIQANHEVLIEPGRRHRVMVEQIGGRLRMVVDDRPVFDVIDLCPMHFPAGRYLSLYSSHPDHHFEELVLQTRSSSLSAADWQEINGLRRQTLKYIHDTKPRYFDSRVIEVADRRETPRINLLFKEITETVTEHLAAERHRQAEDALREANAALEEKIAARTTELKQALQNLRTTEQRYALAAMGSHDGLWDWNLEDNSVYLSPRWKEILGYADQDIPNTLKSWYDLVLPEDLPGLREALQAHFEGDTQHFAHEYRMRHRNGDLRWVLTRGAAIRDQAGNPLRIAGSQSDVSERKRAELDLRHDAMHDALTGLANRMTFRLKVAEALHRRDQFQEPFAILFLDLDGFKAVNDSHGHATGDQLLTQIARRLEKIVRPNDLVARLGGDEFTVLLNNAKGPTAVDTVAERIIESFEQPFLIDAAPITLGVSIGIALGRKQFKSPSAIIRKADSAMYHVKMGKKR